MYVARNLLLIAALPLLSGCLTPQQQCFADASYEYQRALEDQSEIQANIARGYAVHRQEEPYEYQDTCYRKNSKSYPCITTRYRTKETPVAIDIPEQRRRLNEISAELPALAQNANARTAQCRRQYPE